MRQLKQLQPNLKEHDIHHEHAKELTMIERILQENPKILQLVFQDLTQGST